MGAISYPRLNLRLISPSATYMRQWIGLALVHIMACRLFGDLEYC